MNILDAFPAEWRCDVTVNRAGEPDPWSGDAATTTHILYGCLVAPRATSDPTDRDLNPDQNGVLYAEVGADVKSTDSVTVPADHPMAGTYTVEGRPGRWPYGTEVLLRWVEDGS